MCAIILDLSEAVDVFSEWIDAIDSQTQKTKVVAEKEALPTGKTSTAKVTKAKAKPKKATKKPSFSSDEESSRSESEAIESDVEDSD